MKKTMQDAFKSTVNMLLIFFVAYFLVGLFLPSEEEKKAQESSPIIVSTHKDDWVKYQLVDFTIKNNTDQPIVIAESQNPSEKITFEKENQQSKEFEEIQIQRDQISEVRTLEPKQSITLSFSRWNNELFGEEGDYKICLNSQSEKYCTKFALENPGVFRSVWRGIFFKPIFNILIFFVSFLPNHSLALAIFILTLIIKIILIGQSKKALVQQKKMQKVQEEIEKVRKKHAGDQQKIAEETLSVWKKHKVNPVGSFMPMFIQFPVMIALFYVVKDGLMPHNSVYLWPFLSDFSLDIVSKEFFGIFSLDDRNIWYLAVFIGLLQFVSMKLTMQKSKKVKELKKETTKKQDQMADQMKMMNTSMMYVMPLLIVFFSYNMPAAVGIYWGISTLFSIGQQLVLNREKH